MFDIPSCFKSHDEEYLTMPVLKQFTKKVGGTVTEDKNTLIKNIFAYADKSSENKECVLTWLDNTLKEGIKDIYIFDVDIDFKHKLFLNNDIEVSKILNAKLDNPDFKHISSMPLTDGLLLKKFEQTENEYGKCISLYYNEKLIQRNNDNTINEIAYPIFIDFYVEKGIIIGRAKSKVRIFEYTTEFDINSPSTTTAKKIKATINNTLDYFGIKVVPKENVELKYRKKLYNLLHSYTFTPQPIKHVLDENDKYIRELAEDILTKLDIQNSSIYLSETISDILNMAEKYLSISCADKSIFIEDRDAYPIKLKAMDEERSRIEQMSGEEEPLQSKSIFFDNKKMLQNNKECESLVFCFKRKESIYYDNWFKASIKVTKGSYYIKITQYVQEEDIRYVISRIIEA